MTGASALIALILGIYAQSAEKEMGSRELEEKMSRLVNIEREARGLRPLELIPVLSDTARKHSQTMVKLDKISHQADGSLMEERIKEVIEDACRFGENITKHYTIEYALSDLMGSPGHRGNLLDPDFTGFGIGIVRGKNGLLYITQNFISPCKKSPKKKSK
jgi:uncharacterized protein YkwD